MWNEPKYPFYINFICENTYHALRITYHALRMMWSDVSGVIMNRYVGRYWDDYRTSDQKLSSPGSSKWRLRISVYFI